MGPEENDFPYLPWKDASWGEWCWWRQAWVSLGLRKIWIFRVHTPEELWQFLWCHVVRTFWGESSYSLIVVFNAPVQRWTTQSRHLGCTQEGECGGFLMALIKPNSTEFLGSCLLAHVSLQQKLLIPKCGHPQSLLNTRLVIRCDKGHWLKVIWYRTTYKIKCSEQLRQHQVMWHETHEHVWSQQLCLGGYLGGKFGNYICKKINIKAMHLIWSQFL